MEDHLMNHDRAQRVRLRRSQALEKSSFKSPLLPFRQRAGSWDSTGTCRAGRPRRPSPTQGWERRASRDPQEP